MLAPLFLAVQAITITSASAVHKRQDGGAVASNIPTRNGVDEPARGEGRRILVYGRPDLALTVLGEPAAGTAVGISYALALNDASVGRQTFDVNLRDDDDEPNQFDYNDDDELRVRGTQLCVTMSSPGSLTLETCNNSRDDDANWIQDWQFDEENNREWVRIEDDDDDNRCLTASLDSWSGDQAQLTVETCAGNGADINQRFYQVLPGSSAGPSPSGSASSSSSASSTAANSSSQTQSGSPSSTSSPSSSGTTAPAGSNTPNAGSPRNSMWGRSIFRFLAGL